MPIERFYSLTEIVLCGRIVSLGADGRVLLIPKMGVLYLILRAVHIVLETFIQVVYIEYGARSSRVILRPVLVKFAIHGSYAPSFAIRIAVHPFVATLVLIAQTEEKSFIVAGFPLGSGVLYHHHGFRVIAVFAYPRQMIAYVIRVIGHSRIRPKITEFRQQAVPRLGHTIVDIADNLVFCQFSAIAGQLYSALVVISCVEKEHPGKHGFAGPFRGVTV